MSHSKSRRLSRSQLQKVQRKDVRDQHQDLDCNRRVGVGAMKNHKSEHNRNRDVKNLLIVLSSMSGQLRSMDEGLGSTQVTATEIEVLDNCAKKARSEESIDDVDQHLVDNWWCASDGSNDDKKGYMRYLEGGKCLAQCRGDNK